MGTHLGVFCMLSSGDVALKRARGWVSASAGGYWGMGDSPGGVLCAFKQWCGTQKGCRWGFAAVGGGYRGHHGH